MGTLSTENRDGIAWVVLDLPGEEINKINRQMGEELNELLDRIRPDTSVRAVVLLSGKPNSFIAGADIDEFVALRSKVEAAQLVRRGQALINKIADLGKPVVSAIHGACLGGGLEAALACTYRIATDHPKTVIGLPEVQLGILPAASGCQRLPRLIGVRGALDIILAGRTVPAKRAYRAGIVDELVHPAVLEDVAFKAAERLAGGWRARRRKGGLAGFALDGNPIGRAVVFRAARKQVLRRTRGNFPAPLAALDAVKHGLRHGVDAGLKREVEHFAELAVGDVSRKLVQIFFGSTALKKDSGVDGDPPPARRVRNLAVVGSGFMGSAIGGVATLNAKVDVRFRDADWDRVAKGLDSARGILKNRLRRRRITKYDYRDLNALLSGDVDWNGFARADLVIEAVFEDLAVKHDVFKSIEELVGDECVLASNTSTIPIGRIAEAVRLPERVLGMHFFSPVEKMPLLEVIVSGRTADWAVTTAVAFGRRMGKTVIVVSDHPGFWVNRILSPYMTEAGHLVHEGVPIELIDRTMTKFGFPVGPISLLDEVGLDVAEKSGGIMHKAFGDRLKPLDAIAKMTAQGRLGRKSNSGFYRYKGGHKRGVDKAVYGILGVTPNSRMKAEDVEVRLVYAMLNEAVRALDEGVVRSPRDGDMGAIFGIGYPPFRGGPLRYLDDIGAETATRTLERLSSEHGDRFKPASRLVSMANSGELFYPRS